MCSSRVTADLTCGPSADISPRIPTPTDRQCRRLTAPVCGPGFPGSAAACGGMCRRAVTTRGLAMETLTRAPEVTPEAEGVEQFGYRQELRRSLSFRDLLVYGLI